MNLLELYCYVDDFCQTFPPHSLHQMRFRDFKTYYFSDVLAHLHSEFPGVVSYNRFVELIPSALVPLCADLHRCYGDCTGISFIDSAPIAVCHNRRIGQHRVFAGVAQRGKNSVGWFYGFKLHLVLNDRGELLACCLTAGNTDDRAPVSKLAKWLFGWLYGDCLLSPAQEAWFAPCVVPSFGGRYPELTLNRPNPLLMRTSSTLY